MGDEVADLKQNYDDAEVFHLAECKNPCKLYGVMSPEREVS